jgi:leucyl aminopeptidase
MIGVCRKPVKATRARQNTMDLPDFAPLKLARSARALTRASIDSLDHLLIVVAPQPSAAALRKVPQSGPLERLFRRATKRGAKLATTRAANSRATGMTMAAFDAQSTFAALAWAKDVVAECLRDKPGQLGVVIAGLAPDTARAAALAIAAAAAAAAFELPTFKKPDPKRAAGLRSLRLLGAVEPIDLAPAAAAALGNNVARWFTALPPNVLTATAYRDAIAELAAARKIGCRFIGEPELAELGAGAFLAVSQGNAARDAGIVHLSYRPSRSAQPTVALVGKGILFDTGGTNLKPFKSMLDMHTDMQGSAVALGTLLALAELDVPFGVDAWLAITENRLSPVAYKSQDVVFAANGTSIQVIHTDAEGRMVLADTLALAARERPGLIVDYATLTGACVGAVTERYSGAFTNRPSANALVVEAGAASGERVWPFPMDEDFDEALKSDVADVKQCAVENFGDHILAARFLSRFVPREIPWIHIDLSAGQHKGGLAHVPTDITGFGVRFTLELLTRHGGAPDLAKRLAA